jgi:hypothetical protein
MAATLWPPISAISRIAPWTEYQGGKAITKAQIARLLKPFISSGKIRLPDDRTAKGYYLNALTMRSRDTSLRKTSQRHNPRISTALRSMSKRHTGTGVTFPNCPKPRAFLPCDGVTPSEAQFDGYAFGERAAIREIDGGYSRAEAERLARAEIAVAQRHR